MSILVGVVPSVFVGLCALACPLGMGVMMWVMMRGNHGTTSADGPPTTQMPDTGAQDELTRLRAEVADLRAARAEGGSEATAGRT
jgi:hypothetical protein